MLYNTQENSNKISVSVQHNNTDVFPAHDELGTCRASHMFQRGTGRVTTPERGCKPVIAKSAAVSMTANQTMLCGVQVKLVGPYLSCEIKVHLQGPFLVTDRCVPCCSCSVQRVASAWIM